MASAPQSKKNLNYSFRKSTVLSGSRPSISVSRRTDHDKRASKTIVRLIDANGIDVTPLPLLLDEKRLRDEREISTEQSQPSVHSGSSLHLANPFAFTRSLMSCSSPTMESHSDASDENTDRYRAYSEIKMLIQSHAEILTEAELDKPVDVKIAETDTFWIFDQPPSVMSQDADDAAQQAKRNAIYKSLLASRIGNDRYTERGMNTFNNPVISKYIQTERICTTEKSAEATIWDMADTFQELQKRQTQPANEAASPHEVHAFDKGRVASADTEQQQPQQDEGEKRSVLLLQDYTVAPQYTRESVTGVSDGEMATNSTTPKDTMVSNSESDLFEFRYSVSTQLNAVPTNLDIMALPRLQADMDRMERALNTSTYYEKLLEYEALHLRQQMNAVPLERSDTDPSSTGGIRGTNPTAPSPVLTGEEHSAGQLTTGKHSTTAGHTANSQSLASQSQTVGPTHSIQGKLVEQKPVDDHNLLNPDVALLWRYHCPMTKGRNITDMAWNRENPNILAVGYGQFEFEGQRPGLVCCWTLKYIEYPGRFYETPSGVTAVGWSKINSNLLAVGMFSGVILVFDVRKKDPTPIIDTTHAIGRHLGAVRKLQWVIRQSGRAENLSEVLVSVSTDGRVTEWFVRKGFDSTGDCDYHCDLMVLKRSYTSAPGTVNKSKRNESLISRTAFGSCIAFNKRDPSIYLVGTEEGPIHKCSCSYNEQYLDTFSGHTAPVYQIEWSPFVADVFLSCSADWTIKLWHLDHQQPLINIQTNISAVPSISWSPFHSVLFAAANESSLEIWNLDSSAIEPYVSETVSSDSNMTSVIFSECSDSVLIGDSQGTVHVYNLVDFSESPTDVTLEAMKLNEITQTCIKENS